MTIAESKSAFLRNGESLSHISIYLPEVISSPNHEIVIDLINPFQMNFSLKSISFF